MTTEKHEVFSLTLGFVALCFITVLLYLPYSGNPAVFDDHNIITNLSVYTYAQEVFSSYSRVFTYFTIGLIHVISGADLAWNRAFNIALHCFVVMAVFFFLRRGISGMLPSDRATRNRVCLFVSLWIALNPVAIYGVGYLVQRTIVFAALFGLLSATLYLRAQQDSRPVDMLSASLLACLSMMSKEHALLLPVAVVALTPLVCRWSRVSVIRASIYLALTIPCAAWVLLHRGISILGNSYEEYAGDIVLQLGGETVEALPGGVWSLSIATQLVLFWKYLFLWIVPNTDWMSVDMRIDFQGLWRSAWVYAALVFSIGVFLVAAICWVRRGTYPWARRWAAVMAFIAIPFIVELSVVRVQEPFVLYRSYLWMPGYALFFAVTLLTVDGALVRLSGVWLRRAFWGSMLIACVVLYPLAQNRLHSFSSEEALWLDAVHKLPRSDLVGADRIYYNLASEAYKSKKYQMALDWSEKVIAHNPKAFQGYLVQGTSLLALGYLDSAMQSFNQALASSPPERFVGHLEFYRCGVMEALGQREEMLDCLRRSATLGYEMARFRLQMLGVAE